MMVRTPTIKAVFLALMILAVTSSAAYAACPSDMVSYWQLDHSYDDAFTGTSLDSTIWVSSTGSPTVSGGELKFDVSSGSGTVKEDVYSGYIFPGDFDVQVDFNDLSLGGTANLGGPYVYLSVDNGDAFYIRRDITGTYKLAKYVNLVSSLINSTSTSDLSGKFRMVKSGNTLSGYYWSGGWVLLGSDTNARYNSNIRIILRLALDNPTGSSSVDFDNFVINRGEPTEDSYGSNNGTIDGAVGTTGKVGNALQFDGSNDYVSLGSPSSLQITQELSIAAWVYAGAMPDDKLWAIVSSQNASTFKGVGLYLDSRLNPDSQTSPRRHIHFQIGDGSWHTSNVNAVVPTNEWVHIVATRKAGEAAKVYYNGVSQPLTSVAWSGNILYDSPWYVSKFSNPITYPGYLSGKIDEVAIYDTALSAGEVAELYSGSNRSLSYCALEPIATGYDTGSTNLSVVADLTNVSGLTLVKTGSGTIKWTAPVDVVGADLSSQVRIGTGFVSINTSSLHSSLDGPANVSITVEGCNDYTVYYATGYQSSLAALKSVGQVCNAGTTPACTNIKCEGTTLSFTVSHFDGYGGEGSAGQPVPEFGTWALMMALGLTIGGFVAIRRKK